MDGPTQYFQWGFIQISLANLIVIGLLIVVFALSVLVKWSEKNRLSTVEPVTPEMVEKTEVEL
jgi:hypothetical protein